MYVLLFMSPLTLTEMSNILMLLRQIVCEISMAIMKLLVLDYDCICSLSKKITLKIQSNPESTSKVFFKRQKSIHYN